MINPETQIKKLSSRRWIALFLCICILVSDYGSEAAAATLKRLLMRRTHPHSLFNPVSFSLPEELGTVEEKFQGKSSETVIFISDAHAVRDAQSSIRNVLAFLQKKYGPGLVSVEGASGYFDTSLLRAFPDEKIRVEVLTGYLNKGELSGAGLASILNERSELFFGMEDWKLYERNYLAWLDASRKRIHASRKSGKGKANA